MKKIRKETNDSWLVIVNGITLSITAAAKLLGLQRQCFYVRLLRSTNGYEDTINGYRVTATKNSGNLAMIEQGVTNVSGKKEYTPETRIREVTGLSNKLLNLFVYEDICGHNPNLSQIAEYTLKHFKEVKGFGVKCLNELNELLFSVGLNTVK